MLLRKVHERLEMKLHIYIDPTAGSYANHLFRVPEKPSEKQDDGHSSLHGRAWHPPRHPLCTITSIFPHCHLCIPPSHPILSPALLFFPNPLNTHLPTHSTIPVPYLSTPRVLQTHFFLIPIKALSLTTFFHLTAQI